MDAYNLAVCFAPTLLALSPQEWSPEKRPRGRCGAYFSASYDLMSTKEVIQSKVSGTVADLCHLQLSLYSYD